MTVKKLIERLKTLDQNTKVKVYIKSIHSNVWEYNDVWDVEQEEDDDGEKVYVIYT